MVVGVNTSESATFEVTVEFREAHNALHSRSPNFKTVDVLRPSYGAVFGTILRDGVCVCVCVCYFAKFHNSTQHLNTCVYCRNSGAHCARFNAMENFSERADAPYNRGG